MDQKDTTTEQIILQAAEKEFIEKGFVRTKTTDIAKRAGVNHAMLHYYFRTKEYLFNLVFEEKAKLLAGSLSPLFNQEFPFLEKIKLGIEAHFDFLIANPQLPYFIYNEILSDEKRREFFFNILYPQILPVMEILEEEIRQEIIKGTIRYIEPMELLLNIVSLNVFSFITLPLISQINDRRKLSYEEFLQERRRNSVRVILNDLKCKEK